MATISVSNVTDGTTATAAGVNNQINTIVNEFNGNIDNANIKSAAAIDGSKLADNSVLATKLDWASTGANAGIWWEELGRTTLGVAGDTISVTSIEAKKYIKVLVFLINTGGTLTSTMRFNNDSTGTYAYRYSDDGAAHTTANTQTGIPIFAAGQTFPFWGEYELINYTSNEKQYIGNTIGQNTAGAGNVPGVREIFGKWANTAAQITRIDVINSGTGDYAIGSEVIVLGHN